MRFNIMPPRAATQTLDVSAMAHVIDNTHDHELFALALVGETAEERAARRAAAADIVDELATEFATDAHVATVEGSAA